MMTQIKINIREVAAYLLAFLFAYTAVSKWYDWKATKWSLYNQVFPEWLSVLILYSLSPIELALAWFLTGKRTRRPALWISLGLLLVFTTYIGLVLLGIFDRVPCSCGGVLSSLDWEEHLMFNLVFIVINVIGILFGQTCKERREEPLFNKVNGDRKCAGSD
ncbi:hypothetical protein GCM10028791_40930 [Echinicola sediminis]